MATCCVEAEARRAQTGVCGGGRRAPGASAACAAAALLLNTAPASEKTHLVHAYVPDQPAALRDDALVYVEVAGGGGAAAAAAQPEERGSGAAGARSGGNVY